MDLDILQDFLIESKEIIEELQEQLVELESNPEDKELLNAIFRGFHTIKGGAGFLGVTQLVDICHVCENVFDELRAGRLTLSSSLMDVVLKGFDQIALFHGQLEQDEPVGETPSALIKKLENILEKGSEDPTSPSNEVINETEQTVDDSYPISDDEYEALLASFGHGQENLNQVIEPNEPVEPPPAKDNEDITDEEFEALLDDLHGKGKGPTVSTPSTDDESSAEPVRKPQPKKNQHAEATVRVDTKRLDQIMNMVGELVLVRNRLLSLNSDNGDSENGTSSDKNQLGEVLTNLDLVTSDLQNAVVKTRMQPIKKVFGRFPRVVRDLSKNLGKDITLVLKGEETELDKNLVEALSDPLIHMVRNSVDHGVEFPEERRAAGKSPQGTVVLSAIQEGDNILLSIQDDGAGMDAEKLKALAIERKVIDLEQAGRMTDNDAFNLIFAPGFSTKTEISDISGRGVGMDVVKTSITQLNGQISIDSEKGKGTKVVIKVPLTLAIQPTMMITANNQTFAFPLSCIDEIYKLDPNQTNLINGQLTTTVRGKTVPLLSLNKWLSGSAQNELDETDGEVLLMHIGSINVAVRVDGVIGQEEVVIKPLGAFAKHSNGVAGATITSNGDIALIMDLSEIVNEYNISN
ncbi:chemotaxis protein CheA [Vibrio sp. D431a]|uniref:chemotaxis protein CheA n=1 Tax=Vibrio sp. D431a TaxID=2837388 RepID=UPI002554145C|nr:chemotaxis protein CheA [Vibrio sp. D431a]MDK9793286.1 chemotaxis protein CheA [Vibrio sp. D431a]